MTPSDTKTHILDAAERLFAEKGFDGTAIREITRAASVNVAAIHYHYGSKEEVLRGVTDRIVGRLNSRRFELLDRALADAQPHPASIEAILDAFIRPDIEVLQKLQERGPTVAHFLGRTYMDPTPWIQQMAQEQFAEAQTRFIPVLATALDHLTFEEILWRGRRMAAILIHLFATWPDDGMTDAEADDTLARLIRFLAPALQAPAPEDATKEVKSETP